MPVEARDASLLLNVQTGSAAQLGFYSTGTPVFFRGVYSGRNAKSDTRLQVVPKLRVQIYLYTLMSSWRGEGQLYLFFLRKSCKSIQSSIYVENVGIIF